jgi:hypothetical protein
VRADRSGTDSEQVTTCSNQQQQQKNIIWKWKKEGD